ncbi:MAG: hypothetical protein ACLU4N_26500 [Butyricimonas faecihominis]
MTETKRERTPVREVYNFIISDLDSAIKYLPPHPTKASRYQARIECYRVKSKGALSHE